MQITANKAILNQMHKMNKHESLSSEENLPVNKESSKMMESNLRMYSEGKMKEATRTAGPINHNMLF